MEGRGYFFRVTGGFIVGVLSLLISIALVLSFWQQFFAFLDTVLSNVLIPVLVLISVVMVWAVLYAFGMLCLSLYEFLKRPRDAAARRPKPLPAPKAPAKKKRRRGKAGKK